jgi:fructose/tagatose bisphosphate aldolase
MIHTGEGIRLPQASLSRDLTFTNVGRQTREHFFTPMELLRPVVGLPMTVMQANIRHRSQTRPYLEALLDSKATSLVLAISENVQREFGVCVEEVTYNAAKTVDELNKQASVGTGTEKKRVAFLFDHALTYEAAEEALESGVSGLMYDPSDGGRRAVTIDENIQLSKRFVELAERYDASVELEVGVIPGMEGATETEFTDPAAVAALVKAYPDAAVAVSVGNEHYRLSPKGRGLQLGLFERIRQAVPGTPLVLHGGTGVSDEDLGSAISSLLLDKLNVGTEFIRQTLTAVARVRGMTGPSEKQLQDPVFCRELLYYIDEYPEKYLVEAQRAVCGEASTKLAFLSGVGFALP